MNKSTSFINAGHAENAKSIWNMQLDAKGLKIQSQNAVEINTAFTLVLFFDISFVYVKRIYVLLQR